MIIHPGLCLITSIVNDKKSNKFADHEFFIQQYPCHKKDNNGIVTWIDKSMYHPGKMHNFLQEMS